MENGPSFWEFAGALGVVAVIMGISSVFAFAMTEYIDPWRAKRAALRRVRGWHIVTLNRRDRSKDSYCDNKMTKHWFKTDVGVWCLENCQGDYGTIPVFGELESFHVEQRSYAFERVDDAMMFKLVWG